MQDLVKTLSKTLREKGLVLVTAESCTGGLIASALTDLAGSSSIFDRGFVTYSNQAKIDMLDVDKKTLDNFGAVSAETAIEMAKGALNASQGDIAVSVTGIAGPDGGTQDKPVGTVFIGIAAKNAAPYAEKNQFSGSRHEIRSATLDKALRLVLNNV